MMTMMLMMTTMMATEDYVDDNHVNYDDEDGDDKYKTSTAIEMKWLFNTQMIYLHLQVCYPSLLVTPQHWSRVPHARFDDFLHFDYFALPTLCATFPHVRFD